MHENKLRDELPFVAVTLLQQGQSLTLTHVLVDTGSAGSLFMDYGIAMTGILGMDFLLQAKARIHPYMISKAFQC